MISLSEIKELASRCDIYLETFIEEQSNKNFNQQVKAKQEILIQIINNEEQTQNFNKNIQNESINQNKLDQNITNIDIKLNTKKLCSQRDNTNKKNIILQFSIISILSISYFIISLILQINFLQNKQNILNNLKLNCQRNSILKYNFLYTYEEIINDKQEFVNIIQQFTALIYTNEKQIFDSYMKSYPTKFDQFNEMFKNGNFDNVCILFKEVENLTLQQCEQLNDKILQSGLKLAIVSYTEGIQINIFFFKKKIKIKKDIRQFYNNFSIQRKQKSKLEIFEEKNTWINLEKLQRFLINFIEQLNIKLLESIQSYLDDESYIEEIKFSIFIFFLAIILLLFWLPYCINLTKKIWSTKTMLNMIPIEIIFKDKNIKQYFINGGILQAVK
ncbi:hypothetical protein IMG5_001240 [Ichthyophthirius multifiliis]|uniref:Transmembrane protein n=1 Tax=Ichthyophthirius multifiliis TaxID=5932 RepID=G0QIR6_ICHMU|nr:hypothetical protein IMG5_001240 [Ichthyophthirius multifiliis]EGR34895.1 hypothetical protein IMG5_001240 [Ichthyophthirius multifiliis]|eukprot:XP_004040199.1 hypothetical protein IMG5_001240 [Ichthyophthirius multifiliis]